MLRMRAFGPRFHRAVELIGRCWSGAIINAMMPGAQCFKELLVTVQGLSDRLLTERLREFESEGRQLFGRTCPLTETKATIPPRRVASTKKFGSAYGTRTRDLCLERAAC